MGNFDDEDIARQNGYAKDGPNLYDYARKVEGEVKGSRVLFFLPNGKAVTFSVAHDGRIHVYASEVPLRRAYAFLHAQFGTTPPDPEQAARNALRARQLWEEARSAEGTLVEDYLRSRCISLPPPTCLRFIPSLYHAPSRLSYPAMIAARLDCEGNVAAVHRTWLSANGSGKAPIEPQRMDLGPIGGTAIHLAPHAKELLLGEGIETVLAAMVLSRKPGWAAGSAKMLSRVVLPAEVRVVRLLVDVNDSGAGELETERAASRYFKEGRDVYLSRPPIGGDFNDVLIHEVRRG